MRRVHVLPCGYEESDKGFLTLMKDCGRIVRIPYHAYLVEDPEFTLLVDTGASPRWRELHPEAVVKACPIRMEEKHHLDNLLESAGFSTGEVNIVVNTHLHYDHCGNNPMFPKARFLVSESELIHALAPAWWEGFSYVRAVFDDHHVKYEGVTKDFEVTPGVKIVSTPGHTEGHQSVVVQLERTGTMVLAGDAIYLRENLEDPILPGTYVDARRYAHSMMRLKHIVDLQKGTMLLSHSREYLSPDGWKPLEEGIQTFQ